MVCPKSASHKVHVYLRTETIFAKHKHCVNEWEMLPAIKSGNWGESEHNEKVMA